MRILLYSVSFEPNVGGVERISHVLATGLAQAGHQVTVLTETPGEALSERPYTVIRHPGLRTRLDLVRSHDIVHSNGASLSCVPLAWICHKPFIWTHQAYQVQSIDGAGWADGSPAPLTPWASVVHHHRVFGLRKASVGAIKLWLRRWVGKRVAANVAISQHVARRQPLPRQRVIYNPIEIGNFAVTNIDEAIRNYQERGSTFTFVGRLITEKGVDGLIYAFASLVEKQPDERGQITLKIIGDGPERKNLEALTNSLKVATQIRWMGVLSGTALAAEVRRAGICVIPSAWEEPMGIVILELMSAGKPLIVSDTGALSEYGGDACRTFPNRDREALARVMEELYSDPDAQQQLIANGLARIRQFHPADAIAQYAALFDEVIRQQKGVKDR